jgi:hypothetical protein
MLCAEIDTTHTHNNTQLDPLRAHFHIATANVRPENLKDLSVILCFTSRPGVYALVSLVTHESASLLQKLDPKTAYTDWVCTMNTAQ